MFQPIALEPQEETYSNWNNPLSVPQIVDLHHGSSRRPTRYKWMPGETKTLPSRFDVAIHRVSNGVIIGGLAPQLVKLGSDEILDSALDPTSASKRAAEAAQVAAMLQKKAAEEALLIATGRIVETSEPAVKGRR
jgi:hypothetical protein